VSVKTKINVQDLMNQIQMRLEQAGSRARLLPARYVERLESEIDGHLAVGALDADLAHEYLDDHDYQPARLSDGTAIVVATPQPQIEVAFTHSGQTHNLIIPPTYLHDTDTEIEDIIGGLLEPYGYSLSNLQVVKKALAVHSGLALYGRNNLAYVPGMGSFHRLTAFLTDMPAPAGEWQEFRALDLCGTCRACIKGCPTGAIGDQRFLIRAERCLTYHNEGRAPFPDWIDPDWHNSLVGCMHCQLKCPENRALLDWIEPGERFTQEETRLLLVGTPQSDLPAATVNKLESMNMLQYLEQLPRNLAAVLPVQPN